jgi:hypothetical protein
MLRLFFKYFLMKAILFILITFLTLAGCGVSRKSWNQRYVLEWNNRHRNPLRYGDFYQTEIYYDVHEDYGLELNYQLYNYFLFIEQNYGIELIRRR